MRLAPFARAGARGWAGVITPLRNLKPGHQRDGQDAPDESEPGGPGGRAGAVAAQVAVRLRPARPYLLVAGLMLAYTIYFSRLTINMYRGYAQPGFDLGIFDQGIWLLSRFHAPFVTIMGRDLFGDHTSFILLLLVPIYWVYPHVAALLVIQSAALALGALPVYLLARRLLHDNIASTLLAAAFLLNPALQGGNIEQFHPECFLVPLVGFAIYAAVTSKRKLLIVTVVLCLLVKEDAALLVVPLGLWVAYRRDRALGLKVMAGGVLAGLIATEVVIRTFLGTPSLYTSSLLPFGGVNGFLSTLLRKPGQVADYLTSGSRPFYLWQMSFPSAFLFLRAPSIAAIGLAVAAENVVSNLLYQHEIRYHYSLSLAAVLAMGTVFAIGALKAQRHRVLAVGAVAWCSLYACFLWGAFPLLSVNKVPHLSPSAHAVQDMNAVQAALPANAVVSASDFFVTHVDHRQRAYQWPTPFQASYWGDFTQTGRLPFANQVQYLFLELPLSPSDQKVLSPIRSQFVMVKQQGDAMLLKRRPGSG